MINDTFPASKDSWLKRLVYPIRLKYHHFAITHGPVGLTRGENLVFFSCLVLIVGFCTDWSVLTLMVSSCVIWGIRQVPRKYAKQVISRALRPGPGESGEAFTLGMFTAWFLLFAPRFVSWLISTAWAACVGTTDLFRISQVISAAMSRAVRYLLGEAAYDFATCAPDAVMSMPESGIQTSIGLPWC